MLPLKHLIIPKETRIHSVPFTIEPQEETNPSALLAKGTFASTRWWEAWGTEWGESWHCLCSHSDNFFKNAAFERKASSVWCQGAEKPHSHSWWTVFCALPLTWIIVLTWLLCSCIQVLPSGYLLACICLFCICLSGRQSLERCNQLSMMLLGSFVW